MYLDSNDQARLMDGASCACLRQHATMHLQARHHALVCSLAHELNQSPGTGLLHDVQIVHPNPKLFKRDAGC